MAHIKLFCIKKCRVLNCSRYGVNVQFRAKIDRLQYFLLVFPKLLLSNGCF